MLVAELNLAEAAGDDQIYIGCLERLLAIDPGNSDRRFHLAYKYSLLELDGAAAFHYSRIDITDRDGGRRNNLGVSLDRIGLPGFAIAAYRESEALGETLATANVAGKLIEGGFLSEAQQSLDRAVKLDDHHVNVDKAVSRLKSAPEREEKNQDDIFTKARVLSEFNRPSMLRVLMVTAPQPFWAKAM